jgi:hypothetical protein
MERDARERLLESASPRWRRIGPMPNAQPMVAMA